MLPSIRMITAIQDGDTVFVNKFGTEPTCIRLAYIDAPELSHGQWGIKARSYLRTLLSVGDRVMIVPIKTDPFNRTIAEVLRIPDYANIGLRMVYSGNAALYFCPSAAKSYWSAQGQARSRHLGIWAMPGSQQTPWDDR